MNKEIREKYCEMITHFYEQKRNTVIIHDNEKNVFRNKVKIDLWWGGLKGNGALMMILAYPGFLTKKFFRQQGFTTPRLRMAGEGKISAKTYLNTLSKLFYLSPWACLGQTQLMGKFEGNHRVLKCRSC